MNIQLSRDADHALCVVYNLYLTRRKNGEGKGGAKMFRSLSELQEQHFQIWSVGDLAETISEIGRAGLAQVYLDGSFVLNDSAIIYMENRFKNGVKELTDFIAKFIP